MGIYNSYAEAVIANGSIEDVRVISTDGLFCMRNSWKEIQASPRAWGFDDPVATVCNPADYLETLEDFHARGLELTDGDKYTGLMGQVYTVGEQLSKRAIINRNQDNNQRFVVKAAAYDNTETPEEREVFESMSSAIAKCADWPHQGESVTTPVGKGEFLTKVYTKGETLYVVQFENTFGTFPIEAIKPIDTGYEAGKKLRELWLSLRIIDTPEQPFDKVGSGIRKAWIELAKHVKPIDEEAK